MRGESLTPVEEVSVVRAGSPFDFGVPLDMRLTMLPQDRFLARELPSFSLSHMPVFLRNPALSLVRVSASCPSAQSEVEHIVTAMERFCYHRSAMIIGPSSIDPI